MHESDEEILGGLRYRITSGAAKIASSMTSPTIGELSRQTAVSIAKYCIDKYDDTPNACCGCLLSGHDDCLKHVLRALVGMGEDA